MLIVNGAKTVGYIRTKEASIITLVTFERGDGSKHSTGVIVSYVLVLCVSI